MNRNILNHVANDFLACRCHIVDFGLFDIMPCTFHDLFIMFVKVPKPCEPVLSVSSQPKINIPNWSQNVDMFVVLNARVHFKNSKPITNGYSFNMGNIFNFLTFPVSQNYCVCPTICAYIQMKPRYEYVRWQHAFTLNTETHQWHRLKQFV